MDAAVYVSADVRGTVNQRSDRKGDGSRSRGKYPQALSGGAPLPACRSACSGQYDQFGSRSRRDGRSASAARRWSTVVYIAGFAAATVLAEVFIRYSRYASVLRWLTLSLFAYVGTVFVVGVPWLTVAENLALPRIRLSGEYLTVVVAVFGTTISPYLFFWQAAGPYQISDSGRPLPNFRLTHDPHFGFSKTV
jgi:hypothetical protein